MLAAPWDYTATMIEQPMIEPMDRLPLGSQGAVEGSNPPEVVAIGRLASRSGSGVQWLIGPGLLLVTLCSVRLLMFGSDRIFVYALLALFGVVVLWILVSVFSPAHPDRTCPACGRAGLRRLDSSTTRGIRCEDCGHVDEDQSSFLMAEDEGAIEPIVLRSRAAREKERGGRIS